ncbi:hypothetical protein H4582DRAFT_2084278 [Lactarius indigo]|nr:hypothetical protein H4582DRAFT_2084278 [Lactarius indigo]
MEDNYQTVNTFQLAQQIIDIKKTYLRPHPPFQFQSLLNGPANPPYSDAGQDNTTGSNGNTTIRVPPPTRGKRTFSTSNVVTPTPSNTQLGTTKKTRTIGPSHGRPMPLKLAQESELINEQGYDGGAIRGKRVERQGAPSSGHVPPPVHVPSYSNPKCFHDPDVDDDDSASEDNDDDNEQIVELALRNPAKFSEAMATERPTWKEPGGIDTPRSAKLTSRQSTDSPGSSGGVRSHAPAGATPTSTPILPVTPGPKARLAELPDKAGTPSPNQTLTVMSESPVSPVSRIDTDLVFVGSTTKIMLTSQRPLIQGIVQDAIENLRASLLFNNAFPDATVAFAFTRDALLTATESHGHGGGIVRCQLQVDDEYLTKLISLSRARVPHFHSEVKERCNAVSMAPIIATGSAAEISRLIRKQLSCYNYIFLGAPGNMGITGLVRTSHPYRNPRIIAVIRDLYFTGGSTSFVARFHHLFPTYQGEDGVVSREVPMPMVALVATALYATLYEWRGGEQQTAEFSANAYMDVYLTNMNTLKHILNNRERAFHIMMSDIYAQASTMGGTVVTSTLPIADLDLDELE